MLKQLDVGGMVGHQGFLQLQQGLLLPAGTEQIAHHAVLEAGIELVYLGAFMEFRQGGLCAFQIQ